MVNALTNANGSSKQVLISSRQMLLADRMIRRVQDILAGGQVPRAQPTVSSAMRARTVRYSTV